MAEIHIPLYLQIKNYIVEKIADKTFKPGDKIYSENELKDKFKVSSTTVVKALNELVQDGYLERIQGKGSFVAEGKLKRTPLNLSITEELRGKGIDLQTTLLSIEEVVKPEIANILDRSDDTVFCKIKRLRFIEKNKSKEPIVLQTSYIPNDVISLEDLKLFNTENSLYKILWEVRKLKPYRANETYSIHLIKKDEIAELLEQSVGDPSFLVKRTTYTKDETPFEYAESFLRWDRYTLEVEVFETD